MEAVIELVDHWQTLVGAFIGGFFALLVALLVAYKARRREESSAAMLLVGNLVNVLGAHSTLLAQATKESVPRDDIAPWIAEKLVWSRPKLSPMFEASMVRLMPRCVDLSAHLDLFHTTYLAANHHLDRLEEDFKEFRLTGKSARSKDAIRADAKLATKGFEVAAKHAQCAERLISQLVLGKIPAWHRLKRAILPSKEEQNCRRLLKEGST